VVRMLTEDIYKHGWSMLDNDEITSNEYGFMQGYLGDYEEGE